MKNNHLLFTLIAMFALNFICLTISAASMPLLSALPEPVASSHLSQKDKIRIAQMKQFISLTPEQYGKLSGHKLNFLERFSFNISQHRMKKMLKQYDYGDGPNTLSKISWLLKGLLLGPIALILGYLFLKDDDRELIKWIWFGIAGFAILVAAILLTI
jgi:hypothetical protein